MKRFKKVWVGIVGIIVISNIHPITSIFTLFLDEGHYRYSTYNGHLTFTEFMSRNFKMLKNRHKFCLDKNPDLKDKQVYRLFSKNPLAFWRWRLYFVEEKYKLPYKRWEEIKETRNKEKVQETPGCIREF